jgi:hypothetical protein
VRAWQARGGRDRKHPRPKWTGGGVGLGDEIQVNPGLTYVRRADWRGR